MTSLFFGQLTGTGVPADEKVVRNTATPVYHDAPPAMQTDLPEQSHIETDTNPDLGMVNRQKGSHWTDRFRSRPNWIPEVDNQTEYNAIVDRQVSSSGTAAAKEATGEWGHGTIPYAVGIEPVGDLRDGGKMGNEYFKTNVRNIQDTSDNTMMSTPPGLDRSVTGTVMAEGKVNARKAAMAAAYDAYWNGGQRL